MIRPENPVDISLPKKIPDFIKKSFISGIAPYFLRVSEADVYYKLHEM